MNKIIDHGRCHNTVPVRNSRKQLPLINIRAIKKEANRREQSLHVLAKRKNKHRARMLQQLYDQNCQIFISLRNQKSVYSFKKTESKPILKSNRLIVVPTQCKKHCQLQNQTTQGSRPSNSTGGARLYTQQSPSFILQSHQDISSLRFRALKCAYQEQDQNSLPITNQCSKSTQLNRNKFFVNGTLNQPSVMKKPQPKSLKLV